MKKAIIILTLLITTAAFSACGTNSTSNQKAASNKTKTTASKTNKLASSTGEASDTQKDSNVITNIDSWNHPVKDVFDADGIKINKVEFQNNKTYAIFYVNLNKDLNDENKSYYVNLINKIAAANEYWNYEIKDENKDVDIKVKCSRDKKDVESIDYNKDSKYFSTLGASSTSDTSNTANAVNKDELTDYLKQNVSEVSSFVNTLSKNKNVKPILYIERSPNSSSSNVYLRDYYMIYVGEHHEDHNVNTYRFAINKDTKQILYYNVAKDKYETLQEWRNNRN